jgi:hypothetical protein
VAALPTVMQAKELDMLIIHMGMELNLHKTLCHFLVAQLQVELNLHKTLCSGPITSGAEFAQDPLSLPSGPITRLRAKRFKEALNGLIQENGADFKKTKMGSNNNQGLVHVIKAVGEVN